MNTAIIAPRDGSRILPLQSAPLVLPSIAPAARQTLLRMFADPRVLSKEQIADLVEHLSRCVEDDPESSDLRVVYGMALCVNLRAQEAMEELGEAVRLDPQSYIAHLKMGELWMRLRVMNKARDHTHYAATLAETPVQSELARRQAATIRAMLRHGIERGGYTRKSWLSLARLRRAFARRNHEELAPMEAQ